MRKSSAFSMKRCDVRGWLVESDEGIEAATLYSEVSNPRFTSRAASVDANGSAHGADQNVQPRQALW